MRTFPVRRLAEFLVTRSSVLVLGVKFLFKDEILFSVLLLDGCQSVDIVFKFRSSHLLLLGVRQPSAECLDKVMVGDSAAGGEHELTDRLLAELCGRCHGSFYKITF